MAKKILKKKIKILVDGRRVPWYDVCTRGRNGYDAGRTKRMKSKGDETPDGVIVFAAFLWSISALAGALGAVLLDRFSIAW